MSVTIGFNHRSAASAIPGGGGGLTRFLPPLQQIGQCGSGKKRQALLNYGDYRILDKTCLFRLKTILKIV